MLPCLWDGAYKRTLFHTSRGALGLRWRIERTLYHGATSGCHDYKDTYLGQSVDETRVGVDQVDDVLQYELGVLRFARPRVASHHHTLVARGPHRAVRVVRHPEHVWGLRAASRQVRVPVMVLCKD